MFIIDFFKNVFGSFGSVVGQLFKRAATTAVGALAEGLGDIALEVVQEVESGNLTSGEEKRKAAFQAIKEKAISEGKAFSTKAINLAIELALALIAGVQQAKHEIHPGTGK